MKNDHGSVVCIAASQFSRLVSPEETESEPQKHPTPVERLFRILAAGKKDIIYIYPYAIFNGMVSLVPAHGVQGIISQISGGVVISTIWLLLGIVIFAVLFNGGLQVMQLYIIEI